jgi:type II secretory ATPase GspE/PulE/Tfp pilus assembly ATPase PilB-like protein
MDRELAWLGAPLVGEDEKRKKEALRLGVPFVTLERDDISTDALVLIPEPLSRTSNIVAYRFSPDGGVEVALLDLADLPQIDFLRNTHRVHPRLTDRASLKQALILYQKHLKEKFAGMLKDGKDAAESLLRHALHSGAHYIHLEPAHAEAAGSIVRYRIAGVLHEALRLPKDASRYIVERVKDLAKLFPVETTAQEGAFTYKHDTGDVRVAVTTLPTLQGERVVLRLTHDSLGAAGFSLRSLGLHGKGLEIVHKVLHKQKGAIVVADPDQEGKQSLLYTLLDHTVGPHTNVQTVEEKIAARMPGAHQSQTRKEIGLTIPALLRASLKLDPDVVMVSDLEVGDAATVALSAAARGMFVMGALNARSAEGALEVLRQLEVPDTTIFDATKLVIAERVVRKLCPHAKARAMTRGEGERLEGKVRFATVLKALKEEDAVHEHMQWKDVQFYAAAPCAICGSQQMPGAKEGYWGHIGVQEVMEPGQPIELTLLEDALFKSVQGLVGLEEVLELATE